jgi:hypothetical protein
VGDGNVRDQGEVFKMAGQSRNKRGAA